jgi:hypothetical protein
LQHFARNERKHEYFSAFLGDCHIAPSDDTYKRQEDCMNSVKKEQGQAPVFQTVSETVLVPQGLVESIAYPVMVFLIRFARVTMHMGSVAAVIAALLFAPSVHATAEDDLVGVVTAPLAKDFVNDWRAIEKLRHLRWAPLPPNMLKHCLPDGSCFTRDGVAEIGGRKLTVLTTGARTMVGNYYFRNTGAPFGEAQVLAALQRAGFSAELKRCPVPGGIGDMNWYRLKSANVNLGYLSVQSSCNGKPCEGFVLTPYDALPPLQPNQLRLYSERCSGTAAERVPVSTVMPHEQLAKTLVAIMPFNNGPALYDWKTLTSAPSGIQWSTEGAKKGDLSYMADPNPWMLSGNLTLSGRKFYLLASGSPTLVKTAYFDEGGLHPRGEDLLGVLRAQGLTVQLVRCGPVYTESINNWYRVSGPATRAVMLRQSLRLDGNQVQDVYEIRLDATLPTRDPRDRDPGVAGCK